ncbi:acyl-CoA dehydrogenase family protein [Nocardiopsis protaetiae]|uniref:acyl-CoA dehydrogenase family protein n=1 Tax=Nocardiopsis protaetiae TaxID=3382270 RepID=UPI00387B060E
MNLSIMESLPPAVSTRSPSADRLADALFGDGFAHIHAPWRDLVTSPLFRPRQGLTPHERVDLSYERLRLIETRIDSALDLAASPDRLAALHEWITVADGGITILAGIHYNLFLGSLADHGHPARTAFEGMPAVGTFLCTELAHGNDAASVETTAVHDPATGGFVLHTPVPGARKFMPNTGRPGGPKAAVVAARLVADGTDQGVFLFLVPLTDTRGPLPGVTVEPLDDKAGSPVDHSLTSFRHVPLPADALLGGAHGRFEDGVFTSGVGNRRRRLLLSIGRVTTGKLCMSAAAVGASRLGLAVAAAHGRDRTIASPHGKGTIPVMAMRSHHGPLVEAAAEVYAMTLLHRDAVARTVRGSGDAARAAAVAKAWNTWRGREILTECRERCGARGLFPANRLAEIRADMEGAITAEGDNLPVWVKSAAELLLDPGDVPAATAPGGDLRDPAVLVGLLGGLEWHHLAVARRRLRSAPAGDPLARWNGTVPFALRLVEAHARHRAARALWSTGGEEPLLLDLLRLFALRHLERSGADLCRSGLLSAEGMEQLTDLAEEAISRLAPRLPEVVAAFSLPARLLSDIPLADGRPDDGLLRAGR